MKNLNKLLENLQSWCTKRSVVENALSISETAQDCLEHQAEKCSSPLNVELLSRQNKEQAIINLH